MECRSKFKEISDEWFSVLPFVAPSPCCVVRLLTCLTLQGTQATAPLPIVKPTAQTTTKLSAPLAVASRSLSQRSPLSLDGPIVSDPSSNPWLALDEDQPSGGKVSRKMNKATVSKDSRDSARSAAKIQRHKSKMADVREAEQDDALVEIDPTVVLAGAKAPMAPQIGRAASKAKPAKKVANSKSTLVEDGVDSSDEEDDDAQVAAQRGQGPTAFKQRDLVARAFAGDNVVAVRPFLIRSDSMLICFVRRISKLRNARRSSEMRQRRRTIRCRVGYVLEPSSLNRSLILVDSG